MGLLMAVGCSGSNEDPSTASCVPNETKACLCADGRSGVQQCTDQGVYTPCECLGDELDVGYPEADTSEADTSEADASEPDAGHFDELDPWGDESGDGIPNQYDNCPYDYSPDQLDTAGDGVGDVCDNCPYVANPDQAYSEDNPVDERGIIMGDACAPGVIYADLTRDTSEDGVPDLMDNCPDHYNPPIATDCEDCPDYDPYCEECRCECPGGIYPCEGCAQLDSSGDGVGDICDNCPDHFNPYQNTTEGNPVGQFGSVMGDICAPEPNNISLCGAAAVQPEVFVPKIYIGHDISGSMANADTDSGETRLVEAKEVLDFIAAEFHDKIHFGLGTYPHQQDGGCNIEHVQDVDELSESQLKSLWGNSFPLGLTPMNIFIRKIAEDELLGDPLDDERPRAVLLVTGGAPNCSSQANNHQEAVDAITDLYNDGIPTYVVGFHDAPLQLEEYASAGGTEYLVTFRPDEIAQALTALVHQGISCEVQLPQIPPDPAKIWVSVDGQYLDIDSYTYEPDGNLISFDSEACQTIQAFPGEELIVEMGCVEVCEPEQPQGLCDLWYQTCGEEELCLSCEPEICDGQDNNCSGTVDDNCPDCGIYQAPCEDSGDCCEPFICSDQQVCDRQCYPVGVSCRSGDDCCTGSCSLAAGEQVGLCT